MQNTFPCFFFKFEPAEKNFRKVEYYVSRGDIVLLLGIVCISFQCFPQFSVVVPSFFFLSFFHFLRSSILLITSCVIYDLFALISTFPTRYLIVSNIHFLILFHCTSKFIQSRSIVLSPNMPHAIHTILILPTCSYYTINNIACWISWRNLFLSPTPSNKSFYIHVNTLLNETWNVFVLEI